MKWKQTRDAGDAVEVRSSSYLRDVVRSFMKNKIAVLGLVLLTIIIGSCAFAPYITDYDPILSMDLSNLLVRPGDPEHILGTDDYGRDILSRLLYGGRNSVIMGLSVALFSALIGVIIGCISGYMGGWVDACLMRLTDIMLSFPFLIIAIALMAVLGSSQQNVVLALSIVGWPSFSRLTRSQVLVVKEQEYIESARVAGFSRLRIMAKHVMPNCWGPIIVQLTLSIGAAILSAASLNYLGLGVDSRQPDWGVMLNQGRNYLQQAPYLTIIPGVAISLTVLSINWIGDGLRDAFDPKMRK